jgi:hypothetical protein
MQSLTLAACDLFESLAGDFLIAGLVIDSP